MSAYVPDLLKNTSVFICKWKSLSRGWTFVGWMMNFTELLASAVKVARLSQTILFNWQQPPREFISNICSPYYSNDHCQSWWISVCIIDLKIWERDRLSMHHWRNCLVLWANPLGALIRIKCLSHLFSVADRNNESLNIVFQRNPSPSWPQDILRLFTLCLILHQSITSDQILKTSREEDWQRLNKSNKMYLKANQEVSILTCPLCLLNHLRQRTYFCRQFILCEVQWYLQSSVMTLAMFTCTQYPGDYHISCLKSSLEYTVTKNIFYFQCLHVDLWIMRILPSTYLL